MTSDTMDCWVPSCQCGSLGLLQVNSVLVMYSWMDYPHIKNLAEEEASAPITLKHEEQKKKDFYMTSFMRNTLLKCTWYNSPAINPTLKGFTTMWSFHSDPFEWLIQLVIRPFFFTALRGVYVKPHNRNTSTLYVCTTVHRKLQGDHKTEWIPL